MRLVTRLLALVGSFSILVMLVRNSGVHINITVTIAEPSLQAATPLELGSAGLLRRRGSSRRLKASLPAVTSAARCSAGSLRNGSHVASDLGFLAHLTRNRSRYPGCPLLSRTA